MNWRLARSLEKLKLQLDANYPTRSRISDGTLGDARHQKLKSDHNPNAAGVVTAMDITHDPVKGIDCTRLVEIFFTSKDPRIKYIIWDRYITQIGYPKVLGWKAYKGADNHTGHIHLSVSSSAALYDNSNNWLLDFAIVKAFTHPAKIAGATLVPGLKVGSKGEAVETLQAALKDLGLLKGTVDGIYGEQTKQAVILFQKTHGLTSDGIAGAITLHTLAVLGNVK